MTVVFFNHNFRCILNYWLQIFQLQMYPQLLVTSANLSIMHWYKAACCTKNDLNNVMLLNIKSKQVFFIITNCQRGFILRFIIVFHTKASMIPP